MDTSDIFKMRPDFIHPIDVETLKGLVETLVGFGDFFDSLLDHESLPERVVSYCRREGVGER
jgi:hypothetical protein